MPDYSNAKIYKIQCSSGHYYYGSTTARLLCQRMSVHRRDSQRPRNQNSKLYKHINTIGWDNTEIVLVKNVRCNSRDELFKIENDYIIASRGDELCLNHKVSYRDPSERVALDTIHCECGAVCLKINHKRHLSSIQHRDGIARPEEPTPQ